MNKTLKSAINQLILLVLGLFVMNQSFADNHVIYQNVNKKDEKIELFCKKDLIKIKNRFNIIKIIDFTKESLFLYREGDSKYLEIKIKPYSKTAGGASTGSAGTGSASNNENKKEIFNPNISISKDEKTVLGVKAVTLKFSSNIDKPVTMLGTRQFSKDLAETFLRGVELISRKGNEIFRSPGYFYSLKAGILPLEYKDDNENWNATSFENQELAADLFSVPKEMQLLKTKEYLKEIVDKVSEEIESEINP